MKSFFATEHLTAGEFGADGLFDYFRESNFVLLRIYLIKAILLKNIKSEGKVYRDEKDKDFYRHTVSLFCTGFRRGQAVRERNDGSSASGYFRRRRGDPDQRRGHGGQDS